LTVPVRRALLAAIVGLAVGNSPAIQANAAHRAAGNHSVVRSEIHRAGKWLVDNKGRVVVMHGFNIVRKTAPYYPSHFTAQDARYLVAHGFTGVRIGFIWAGVEPRPGKYDDTYIRHVIALNDMLARHGIHALIDFHQDSWSQKGGGDGAPDWATLSNNLLSDFQAFWDNEPAPDGVGIQTHFAAAWRHVVRMIDRSPGARSIIGYDPFNEPYAGTNSACAPFTPCAGFESGELAAFYRRVIAAIRSTGDQHVLFPEGIAQNGIAEPSLPKVGDAQTAFTFHFYCPITQTATSQSPADAACQPLEQHGIGSFLDYDAKLGVPGLLGEFSCNDANDDNAAMVDLADRNFVSWTAWMYYTAKSDPANCPGQGFLIDDAKPASMRNVKAGKLAAFEVPYVQALAGRPTSYSYDRSSRTLTLVYTARAGITDVFVPRLVYPTGYRVVAHGGQVVSARNSQRLKIAAKPGAKRVSVTLRPTDS
jgi:endoglycosylceramidase